MKFALIGHPVAGSLSPRLMEAAYGGVHRYDLLDFPCFDDAWNAFVKDYDGINVTAPFKQDACARVDVLSEKARLTGAVNLVVPCGQGYKGYNTDVDGVIWALKGLPSGADVLVVGTGGAARAAAHAGALTGCRVSVTGRSPEKGRSLGFPFLSFEEAAASRPDILIYTLPGRAPVPEGLPLAHAVVLEAEYRTPQLSALPCRRYISGREWLLGQAVTGCRIFTGAEPRLELMSKVL